LEKVNHFVWRAREQVFSILFVNAFSKEVYVLVSWRYSRLWLDFASVVLGAELTLVLHQVHVAVKVYCTKDICLRILRVFERIAHLALIKSGVIVAVGVSIYLVIVGNVESHLFLVPH